MFTRAGRPVASVTPSLSVGVLDKEQLKEQFQPCLHKGTWIRCNHGLIDSGSNKIAFAWDAMTFNLLMGCLHCIIDNLSIFTVPKVDWIPTGSNSGSKLYRIHRVPYGWAVCYQVNGGGLHALVHYEPASNTKKDKKH